MNGVQPYNYNICIKVENVKEDEIDMHIDVKCSGDL